MNLQQQQFVQAVIYNTTQDRWYIFFFLILEFDRRLIPSEGGNAYQYFVADEEEAELWLHRFYANTDEFQEIDNTNAASIPATWAGQTFFGVTIFHER
jgi:hypothetical protein